MKRVWMILVLLTSILTLSACKGEEEIVEIDDFTYFLDAIDAYSIDGINGVNLHTKQRLDGEVIHQEDMELLIDRSGPLKAMTYYYEKALSMFSEEGLYEISESTSYFSAGESLIEDLEDYQRIETTESEYLSGASLLLKGLSKDNFVDYEITSLDNFYILEGELKIGSVRSTFNTDISMVLDNQIRIVIDQENNRFIEFEFTYLAENTEVWIEFKPVYEVVSVVLPVE